MANVEEVIRDEFKELGYVLILKLLIGNEEVKSINIKIPETVVYYDGKPMNQFYCGNKEIKLNSPKDGLTTLEVRKFFMDTDYKLSNQSNTWASSQKNATNKQSKKGGTLMGSNISGDEKVSRQMSKNSRKIDPRGVEDDYQDQNAMKAVNKFSRPFTFLTFINCKEVPDE